MTPLASFASSRPSRPRRGAWIALAVVLAGVLFTALLASCSQTPTQVPLRTFERAQRLDIVCLQINLDPTGHPLSIIPQQQSACAPIPPDVAGLLLQNELFALVTQTTRGELAVVDLTEGHLFDENHGVPGVNFLPVGAIPTDVASTPDSRMIFVGSGEPNKFAIYGIPGHKILGDYGGLDPTGTNNTLPAWPVCALPQRPGAVTVVPRLPAVAPTTTTAAADAGAADAGAAEAGASDGGVSAAATDAGTPVPAAPAVAIDYDLVVVLPGDRTNTAKVVTIDPKPFLRAVPRTGADGKPVESFGDGATLTPGDLQPCPITAAIELNGPLAIPASVDAGAMWDDGVKYVDGGVDLTCSEPAVLPRCGLRPCACPSPDVPVEAGVADAGSDDGGDAGGAGDAGVVAQACDPSSTPPPTPPITFAFPPLDPPQPISIARDDQFLYIADDALPLIHIVDLTNPAAPQELAPFIVSSQVDPSRVVGVKDIAVSPPTRDFKRYLYAIDHKEGTLAVFDVTDPVNASRSPLRRPHPELNPFAPPDRIVFPAPVVSVAFAQHDYPLTRENGVPLLNGQALSGLLCNPNPNLSPTGNGADPGVYYRADSTDPISPSPLGPYRLRGIFGFATLTNGQVVVIDVDDWDAPCRRPQLLTGPPTVTATTSAPTDVGVLAAAQPNPASGSDFDPYHAPNAPPEGVTQELFFPVSAPHRLRSQFYLRDDPTSGKHIPYLAAVPAIQSIGAPLPLAGEGSEATPRLRPTAILPGVPIGTEDIGLRFSIDTPEVQIDQDWTVTFEGSIPGFDGFSATMDTTDGYSSLVLSQPQVHFCAKGVEDWTIGGERGNAIANALGASQRAGYAEPLLGRMLDYVQLTEDLIDPTDQYWTLPDLPGDQACWGPDTTTPDQRYNTCLAEFGAAADQASTRDLPILEAYDDHVVVGTFGVPPGRKTREAIFKDPFNAPSLKRVRCCFHNQARFHVRTGSEWSAVGSIVGFLSHVQQGDGGRCVPSCETRETLLNGRAPSIPYGGPSDFAPFRDSPLALRNPMFSYFVQNGNSNNVDVLPQRDTSWTFSTRGQYTTLVVNIAATTTVVDPQSMRFLEPIGQIAVVDAASQGLVLIDLSTVALARAPFF